MAPPNFLRRFCLVLNHFLEELKKEPDSGYIKPQTLGRVAILQENPDFSKMQNCWRALSALFSLARTRSMYAHARRKDFYFRLICLLFIIFSRFHARRRTPCAHFFCLRFDPRSVKLWVGASGRLVQRLCSPRVHPVRSIWAMQRSPESLDFHGFRGFLRSRPPALFLARCAPSGHEKRAPMRSTPFLDKISENSRPPSRRPSPLSLDIPGFSHVLPSCPALSRLSQLSCLSTLKNAITHQR